jgi:uncharacterized protein YecE (DUF72 family)
MQGKIRIGTAGWAIPKGCAAAFPAEGSSLQRYAQRFDAAEINTTFYRSHRPATYARWAASVPEGFRFAVKMPREITHKRKLADFAEPLDAFLAEIAVLGDRLGPLLVQLPPSLAYDGAAATAFLAALRERSAGAVVIEPRHPSWFAGAVEALLTEHRIARVAADPPPVPGAEEPGGWPGIVYRRLHGSPDMYFSAYSEEVLAETAALLRADAARTGESWCILDNTGRGAACENALSLLRQLVHRTEKCTHFSDKSDAKT